MARISADQGRLSPQYDSFNYLVLEFLAVA
jgi:hypothetical protein